MPLVIPQLSLVLMVGPSGAGKSTFAAKHFDFTEVLSSDHYRGVVSNDTNDQGASRDAFEVLEFIARKRLARGLLTVIDATHVRPESRKQWLRLAREFHVLPVAVVLETPTQTCLARNKTREDRNFGAYVVKGQAAALRKSVRNLRKEGFRYVHRLKSEEDVANAVVERPRPWTDRRDEVGPFDLIGDIHGCHLELIELLGALGYDVRESGGRYQVTPPEGRRALFLGDLVDRGPGSHIVLRLVMDMVDSGVAICVPGNHEAKLSKYLAGRKVKLSHGLDKTVEQLEGETPAFRERVAKFIDGLVSHFILDEGRLIVAHAGMREDLAGRASGKVRQFALYGETTGEVDQFGLPVRYPWARDYRGDAAVVYGHTPVPSTEWVNNTLCIDTGCVFGGSLTALRWPEREEVSVPAHQVWCEPVRPLESEAHGDGEDPGLVNFNDVFNGAVVHTRYNRAVGIRPQNAVAALETLSRYTVDPRWLIHLPPTMSPSETSGREGLLEHPDEAFAYYRKHGQTQVVCQQKHMGSRAMVVVGTSPQAIAERFGVPEPQGPGIVLTRRGRRFFKDRDLEAAFLERTRAAVQQAGLFERLSTSWMLLDGELMPWSAKAQGLLEAQYAPVGAASRAALAATVDTLTQVMAATPSPQAQALLDRATQRLADAQAYVHAYRAYCWPVAGLDDHRFAPFHLLASEGAVHADQTNLWHMETLGALADADGLFLKTPCRVVTLDDPVSVQAAVDWWTEHTASGGEGMVVKPVPMLVRQGRTVIQPALKCRGREYLRIIYGPEYTQPRHLKRLRQRGTGRKRSLAIREFLLGLESLHRFVSGDPLRKIHPCVFGILALESESVDPRL